MAKTGFIARLLGDTRAPDQGTPSHGAPMLSQWLPYRSYDARHDLFYQTDSIAFALELAPLMGADERTGEIIAQMLSESVPPSARVQLLAFQSPRVGALIAQYALPRYKAGGIHRKIAERRSAFLRHGAWVSMSKDGPFHVRNHRIFLSVSIRSGKATPEELTGVRDSIVSTLQSIDMPATRLKPVDLIALIDDITAPAFDVSDHVSEYS